MSTVKTDELSNVAGTKAISVDDVYNGSVVAWIRFDGTGTPSIAGSFNISSITDVGTGNYQLNFTNAPSDINIASIASCGDGYVSASITASYLTAYCRYDNGGASDQSVVSIAAVGIV